MLNLDTAPVNTDASNTSTYRVRVDWDATDWPTEPGDPQSGRTPLSLPLLGVVDNSWDAAFHDAWLDFNSIPDELTVPAPLLDVEVEVGSDAARTLQVADPSTDDRDRFVPFIDGLVASANRLAPAIREQRPPGRKVSHFRIDVSNPSRATSGLMATGDLFFVVAKRSPAATKHSRRIVQTIDGRTDEVWAQPYRLEGIFVGPDSGGRNDGQLRARLRAVNDADAADALGSYVPVRAPRVDGLLQLETHIPASQVVASASMLPTETLDQALTRLGDAWLV